MSQRLLQVSRGWVPVFTQGNRPGSCAQSWFTFLQRWNRQLLMASIALFLVVLTLSPLLCIFFNIGIYRIHLKITGQCATFSKHDFLFVLIYFTLRNNWLCVCVCMRVCVYVCTYPCFGRGWESMGALCPFFLFWDKVSLCSSGWPSI
jgi:hypothetical protein